MNHNVLDLGGRDRFADCPIDSKYNQGPLHGRYFLLFFSSSYFYNFYVQPKVFWKISWVNFMTGQEYQILEGLSNTVSLVVVTVIDYRIENIYFIEIYFNTKLVI